METEESHFKILDFIVLAIVLLISAGIGIYFRFSGGKQKTTQEYLLGDRNQKIIPVALSLMTSFLSAIAILGTSGEMYVYGTQYLIVNLGYIICTPLAAYLYLPVFFKLQKVSAYEYLEIRFGTTSRTFASILYSFQILAYTGIILYVPALALVIITGISTEWAIVSVGLVCTFYSTLGGMKAVIFTDVFQSILMFSSVICVIVAATSKLGGFETVWKIAEERGRIQFFYFDFDPTVRHTFWTLTIGGGLTFMASFAVNQIQVQRYLTMKDVDSAITALWITTPLVAVFYFITGFAGLCIFAVYSDCDPITKGEVSRRDQLMPFYVVESLSSYPGLAGLFVSGIFSGALSHISATTNSMAAITLEDYIKPVYKMITKKTISESKCTTLTKIFALMYGIVCVLIAYIARYFDGVLQIVISIMGVIGGPLLGTFTLGMFVPAANEPGTIVGMFTGVALSLWIALGASSVTPYLPLSTSGCSNISTISTEAPTLQSDQGFSFFRLSYMYYIVVSFTVTILLGSLVSCLASICVDIPSNENPDLFSPPIAHLVRRRKNRKNKHSFNIDNDQQTNTVEQKEEADESLVDGPMQEASPAPTTSASSSENNMSPSRKGKK